METNSPLPQAPIQDVNQSPLAPPKKRKVFPIILTILLLLVLVGAAAFTYLYVQTYTKLNSQLDEITHTNINAKPTPTPNSTVNWKTYNTGRGYVFQYPSSAIITDTEPYHTEIDLTSASLSMSFITVALDDKQTAKDIVIHGFCEANAQDIQLETINSFAMYKSRKTQPAATCLDAIMDMRIEGGTIGDMVKYVTDVRGTAKDQAAEELYSQVLHTIRDTTTPTNKACTQEAKLCPDGSSVGRTGPNCEFTPCPSK